MWPFKASLKYVPVESEDGSASSQSRIIGFSLKVLFLATIIAFLAGSGLSYTIASSLNPDIPHELSWSPTLRPKTQWSKFKGKLMEPSEYRGPPSQAVDDAWKRYTWSKWFDGGSVALGVTKEAIEKSRKFTEDEWVNSTTRLDDADGGGYLATLEMFHQLHCLDMLRKHSWGLEYYPMESFRSPGSLREHLDHCIEMIRQVLMCHADTGLVFFHWIEGMDAAVPDFSTWHKCRNPEEVLEWALDHAAPISHWIRKPEGAVEMPGSLLKGHDW